MWNSEDEVEGAHDQVTKTTGAKSPRGFPGKKATKILMYFSLLWKEHT